jgi:hypothetical protein
MSAPDISVPRVVIVARVTPKLRDQIGARALASAALRKNLLRYALTRRMWLKRRPASGLSFHLIFFMLLPSTGPTGQFSSFFQ